MAGSRNHTYQLDLKWTGNRGTGTSSYTAYGRNHEAIAGSKDAPLLLSADRTFRGDAARYSPEELLVVSLSSCHMLWFLHLCADSGVVVTDYTDAPIGSMVENPDGSGEFTSVTLRPRVTLSDLSREGELETLHHRAHDMCFIARSVRFAVNVEPRTDLVKTL